MQSHKRFLLLSIGILVSMSFLRYPMDHDSVDVYDSHGAESDTLALAIIKRVITFRGITAMTVPLVITM